MKGMVGCEKERELRIDMAVFGKISPSRHGTVLGRHRVFLSITAGDPVSPGLVFGISIPLAGHAGILRGGLFLVVSILFEGKHQLGGDSAGRIRQVPIQNPLGMVRMAAGQQVMNGLHPGLRHHALAAVLGPGAAVITAAAPTTNDRNPCDSQHP